MKTRKPILHSKLALHLRHFPQRTSLVPNAHVKAALPWLPHRPEATKARSRHDLCQKPSSKLCARRYLPDSCRRGPPRGCGRCRHDLSGMPASKLFGRSCLPDLSSRQLPAAGAGFRHDRRRMSAPRPCIRTCLLHPCWCRPPATSG